MFSSRLSEMLLGEPKIVKMPFDKKDNTHCLIKEDHILEDNSGCCWTGSKVSRSYKIIFQKVTKKMIIAKNTSNEVEGEVMELLIQGHNTKCGSDYKKFVYSSKEVQLI